jgi:hypothetical protein
MKVAGIALVLRPGLETGNASPLVVSIEKELQGDRVFDAADETHAEVGLFLHQVFSG